MVWSLFLCLLPVFLTLYEGLFVCFEDNRETWCLNHYNHLHYIMTNLHSSFNMNFIIRQYLWTMKQGVLYTCAALTCVSISWAGRMGLQLLEALLGVFPLSRMAFLALCSFFFILQYSRFLFRKSSSDSPGMGFGGTMVLRGVSLVRVCIRCVGSWSWSQGIFIGLRVEVGVCPGGSMGCRLMLDNGLSGGFRVGRQVAASSSLLPVAHFAGPGMACCRFSGAPRYSDSVCEGPAFILFCSLVAEQETLVMGSLTWRVSGDRSALQVVGLTTRTVGILVTAVREALDGLGWRAGFAGGFTALTVLIIMRPGAWKITTQHEQMIQLSYYGK